MIRVSKSNHQSLLTFENEQSTHQTV